MSDSERRVCKTERDREKKEERNRKKGKRGKLEKEKKKKIGKGGKLAHCFRYSFSLTDKLFSEPKRLRNNKAGRRAASHTLFRRREKKERLWGPLEPDTTCSPQDFASRRSLDLFFKSPSNRWFEDK